MQHITIENQTVDVGEIKQLYPAVIIKTGYKEETTQVSLEWFDTQSKGMVELVEYAIFLELVSQKKHAFYYPNREELFEAIAQISQQIYNLKARP